MSAKVGRALYSKAGELGIPVGFMAFQGLLRHIDEITTLLETYPQTRVIIDHFGFCKFNDTDSSSWKSLLELAKFQQVMNLDAFGSTASMS